MADIRSDSSAVTQITVVEVEPDRQDEVLDLLGKRARFMANQPGCVSICLHRSVDGRRVLNYVQWDSRDALHAAHQAPEFRKEWVRFDEMSDHIDPHLFEVTEVVKGGMQSREAAR